MTTLDMRPQFGTSPTMEGWALSHDKMSTLRRRTERYMYRHPGTSYQSARDTVLDQIERRRDRRHAR